MKRLYRSQTNKMLLGVCAGLAEYFDLDPTLVRAGWVIITVFSGVLPGVVAYLVLAAIMPSGEPIA